MPSYKLTYFDARALGETARQLLHLGDTKFEDERIALDGFNEIRDKYPFGQLPVLSIDGFQIQQSAAINRYLAKKFGYAGKTPEEEAWVDAIGDQFKDFFADGFRPYRVAIRQNQPAEEIERMINEVLLPGKRQVLQDPQWTPGEEHFGIPGWTGIDVD